MEAKYKVEFTEQSKCVTAKVFVECDNEEYALSKAIELYDKAQEYSIKKTMNKLR